MKIRLSLATAASALALAACGGGEPAEEAAPQGDAETHSRVETGHGPNAPERGTAGDEAETGADTMAGADEPAAGMSQEARTILAGFGAPYSEADLENGQRVFRRCAACHTLEDGARHLVGPNLHGIFGREAGSAEGFRFSGALESADFEWTPQQLDEWLANPREFLPGNRMAFPGLRDEQDRTDVIAYIAVETHAEPAGE